MSLKNWNKNRENTLSTNFRCQHGIYNEYIYIFFPVLTGDTKSSLLEIQLIELAVKDNYIQACMIQLTNKLKGIIAYIESGVMIMTIYSSVTLKIG